jgi:hypothetical protein
MLNLCICMLLGIVLSFSHVPYAHGTDSELTPLMEAAENGQTDAVKRLIATGVNVNAKSKEGGLTALMCAAFKGHPDIVSILIANKADVNALTNDGKPVLFFAVGGKNSNIIDTLVKHGAGNKIAGTIASIDTNIMNEARGFGFGLVFKLKEYPTKSFFMPKDLAVKCGFIQPLQKQFDPMKLRANPGKKIEIVYYDSKNDKYSCVVSAKL